MATLFEEEIFNFVKADPTPLGATLWSPEAPGGTPRPYVIQIGVSMSEDNLTLAVAEGRRQRIQFSIFADRTPQGYKDGLEIRDRLINRLRSMRSEFSGNRVDRLDVTVGPEVLETDQYQFPVDALPQYTRE